MKLFARGSFCQRWPKSFLAAGHKGVRTPLLLSILFLFCLAPAVNAQSLDIQSGGGTDEKTNVWVYFKIKDLNCDQLVVNWLITLKIDGKTIILDDIMKGYDNKTGIGTLNPTKTKLEGGKTYPVYLEIELKTKGKISQTLDVDFKIKKPCETRADPDSWDRIKREWKILYANATLKNSGISPAFQLFAPSERAVRPL